MKIIRPFTVNDAALVSSNVLENDYAAYNAATVYALGTRVLYIAADKHWIVESLQNSNTGHTPTGLSTDTWWLFVGNDNRWKMFDQSVNSQTSNADNIDVQLLATGRVDSVAVLNVNAASLRVKMTDAIDGLVYDETYSLVSDSGITDWFAYFFEPIVRISDYAISDMPLYANPTVEVILSDTGSTALCGACIVGLSKELGATQYGMTLGIDDYSVKTQDDFGNYELLERAYRKRSDISMWVENTFVDQLQTLLASYRATPIVYIGSDDFQSSIIYGFYKSFNTNVAYTDNSICTMEIEGLT